jgi:hypothetical protein
LDREARGNSSGETNLRFLAGDRRIRTQDGGRVEIL